MPLRVKIDGKTLELVSGDITEQETEAIVNAANERLIPGGGVDGAIHRKGGPSIAEEAHKIGHCPTGSAVVTGAGRLKARYVIHAVGPIYRDGKSGEAELLASAYRESLKRATELGLSSVAFPSLSTGAYGYPLEEAAPIALTTILDYLKEHEKPSLVRMVLWGEKAYQAYAETLKRLAKERGLPLEED
ncbi:macro domain-containing protein [Thermosulfurimonas marina]|uniref:Macro domain-containing protein n=1 Tax=Thermosulfurimonas marina TaxID=2047767 RepID=A0A6H1WQS1_9BACT|nr:macro domain-containing protein [Thermosulfurimonas marina]QJA05533.1 macro domain-containing protein [Thermosulfurimonas marina]